MTPQKPQKLCASKIWTYMVNPDFEVAHHESKVSVHTLKKRLMQGLKQQLDKDGSTVHTTTLYFVPLPIKEAHHGHLTVGDVAGFSQRMHEKVVTSNSQIVGDGITELTQV